MTHTNISRDERARRIRAAQRMLLAAGWTPLEAPPAGIIAGDLMRKFHIRDRRTALALEARAAKKLTAPAHEVNRAGGRPISTMVLRAGECVEIVTSAGGEVIDASRYRVEFDAGVMHLTSDERDTLVIRKP